MPTSSSSKSKWSLRSMLGRKGATAKDKESGTSSRRHNKCTCKKVEEAASKSSEDECVTSIKERVLAKLKEPLPSEMRQAARLSLDSLSFSPRPSTLTGHGSQRRRAGDEDDAAGLNSRYSTNSNYSSWNLDSDASFPSHVQASATGPGPYISSSSPSSSSGSKLDASGGYWSRSSCSSPTSSNVIARLMGLADHASSNMYTDTRLSFLRPPMAPLVTGCSSARRQQQGGSPRPHSRRLDNKRDCAQDFLDEMEDHLKQCDKALERIEAVMQLKKKLLYLNKASSVDNLSRMDHRRRDVYNYAGDNVHVQHKHAAAHKHVRGGSMDQLIMHASLRRDMKEQQQLVAQEKSKRYRHRRSVSDGETPVFRPAGNVATYDIEPLDHESSSFNKRHTAAAAAASDSEDVKSSRQRQYDHHLDAMKETVQSSPPHTPTKLQCHLELGEESQTPVNPDGSNSEQPSPVSVLDLTPQDESSGSEDDCDSQDLLNFKGIIDKTGAAHAQPTKSRKKRGVVRALWPAASSGGGGDEAKSDTRRSTSCGEVDDAEVVKRMERSWGGGWGVEMAEVGVELEKLIFRRLLEETMIHVASCCRR